MDCFMATKIWIFIYDIQWDTGEYSWQELQDIPVNSCDNNFSYTLNSDNNDDHGIHSG